MMKTITIITITMEDGEDPQDHCDENLDHQDLDENNVDLGRVQKKSCKRETKHLSTDADSSTDTIVTY